MLSRFQANAVCAFIEIATEGNWSTVVDAVNDRGDVMDLCNGVKALADLAGVSEPFTQEDFERS